MARICAKGNLGIMSILYDYKNFPIELSDKITDGEWNTALRFLQEISREYKQKGFNTDYPPGSEFYAKSPDELATIRRRQENWRKGKKAWFNRLDARWDGFQRGVLPPDNVDNELPLPAPRVTRGKTDEGVAENPELPGHETN
jgi:hypothetical protein